MAAVVDKSGNSPAKNPETEYPVDPVVRQSTMEAYVAEHGGEGGGFSGSYEDLTDVPLTFAPSAHTQAASTISDSTAAGRTLLTAADAAAQRTALGLGTAAQATAANLLKVANATDATALKSCVLRLTHATSNNIQCQITSADRLNLSEPSSSQTTTFTKSGNATVGTSTAAITFSLSADGYELSIDMAAVDFTLILGITVFQNGTGTATLFAYPTISSGVLTLHFYNGGTNASTDVTTPTSTRDSRFIITFL